jgi:hypothetical protein
MKCLVLILCVATALVGCRDDRRSVAGFNSPVAARAIRRDLPLLLADSLNQSDLKVTVDSLTTDRWTGVALWHAGKYRGLVVLNRDSVLQRWRWVAASSSDEPNIDSWTNVSSPGRDLDDCAGRGANAGPPSANGLHAAGWIDAVLEARLAGQLPEVPSTGKSVAHLCDRFSEPDDIDAGMGFDADFRHERFGTYYVFVGDQPRNSEKPTSRGRTTLYKFTLHAARPVDANLNAQDSLAIWFPYVLATNARYQARVATVEDGTKVVPLTLKNNVLMFTFPTIRLAKGTVLFGAIERIDK